MDPLRIAVLASGRGSHVGALAAAIERGDLNAKIVAVISNNSKAGVRTVAAEHGLAFQHISTRTDADPGAALRSALHQGETELLVLAGYLKKLDPKVVEAFEGRAVNIHPAPLPAFGGRGMYGAAVHQAVLDSGAQHSAVTVHRVSTEYDEGEVLAVQPVPIEAGDNATTLAARVLRVEHDLYWRVIQTLSRQLRATPP